MPARGRQLSLFGVEARPPAPIDLEGLLAGAGQVTRMGGTGRVVAVVDEPWRCAVLRAELESRGLVVTCEPIEDERVRLRTAYSATLAPLAARWLDPDGVKVAPRDLVMDGRRLRLWVAAAGCYDGQRAYLLRLAPRPRPARSDDSGISEDGSGTADEGTNGKVVWGAGTSDAWLEHEDEPAAAPPARRPGRDDKPNVRKRRTESKVTAFDPGPDEFADAEDFFPDAGADDWPDSGVSDLPTVELDALALPESAEPVAEAGGPGGTEAGEEGIDRQVADNWIAAGDALEALGLPAVFVPPDSGGPAYRIVGPRRITRLAELVGEAPGEAPLGAWPA